VKAIRNYFRNELSSYFQWADHGRELCWCNGTTIAFHEEILPVLDRISDGPFVDFSTIALALATVRGSWRDVAARLTSSVSFLKLSRLRLVRDAAESRRELLDSWPAILRRLDLLHQYAELHSLTPDTRAELISLVVRDCSGSSAIGIWDGLADAFEAGLPEEILTLREADDRMAVILLPEDINLTERLETDGDLMGRAILQILRLIRIASRLATSLPCDTVEELDQLLNTGIVDEIEVPEDVQLPDQRRQARGLLEELSTNDELQGFVRLTKQLIAGVTLPRTLSESDELQMGGVSDLSNRGQLDQLLLSELAHDDLTLSVRLALNEALYLRRELPPSAESRTRCVLIDTSLPLWGIPRLYATAAALALHATTDRQTRMRCFRSGRREVIASCLTTREGLMEQLAALEATSHSGASLESFFRIAGEESECAEPVLITTHDVVMCEEFRQALDKSCAGDLWLILVERDGNLKVLLRTRQGTSVRKQLQLPLKEILSPRTAEQVLPRKMPRDLPAISFLQQFPLRLSHRVRVGRCWSWGETAVTVSDDGRLMHWTEKGVGARQLAVGLPALSRGQCFLVERNAAEFKLLACPDDSETGTLVTIDGLNGLASMVKADYRIPLVTDTWLTDAALLVFGFNESQQKVCTAIGNLSGPFLGTFLLSDLTNRTGRTVLTPEQGFCVLNWIGGFSEWQLQRLPKSCQGQWRTTETTRGTWLSINQQRELTDPQAPDRFRPLMKELRAAGIRLQEFLEVSPDRDLIVIGYRHHDGIARIVVDLRTNRRVAINDLATIEFERTFMKVRQRTLHHAFTSIGVDGQRLLLRTSEGVSFQLTAGPSQESIRLLPETTQGRSADLITFSETPSPLGTSHTLQKAQWPNGSRAWLDSRGVLHLQSASRACPEITLVLCDGPVSGWLSSGEIFGEDYYCGRDASGAGLRRISAECAWCSVVRPFIESVPWTFHFTSDTSQTGNTALPGY